jgi:hypothetical protein
VTGMEAERKLRPPVSEDSTHGKNPTHRRPEPVSGHSLQQAGPVPGQYPTRQDRTLDRGTRRGHRPARALAEPERPAGAWRRPETGVYEVPAGGRRFRALELLVKQKRMAKTQPVPCVVREDGIAEEDSLAENVQRVALLGSAVRMSSFSTGLSSSALQNCSEISRKALQTSGSSVPAAKRGQRLTRRRHHKLV